MRIVFLLLLYFFLLFFLFCFFFYFVYIILICARACYKHTCQCVRVPVCVPVCCSPACCPRSYVRDICLNADYVFFKLFFWFFFLREYVLRVVVIVWGCCCCCCVCVCVCVWYWRAFQIHSYSTRTPDFFLKKKLSEHELRNPGLGSVLRALKNISILIVEITTQFLSKLISILLIQKKDYSVYLFLFFLLFNIYLTIIYIYLFK